MYRKIKKNIQENYFSKHVFFYSHCWSLCSEDKCFLFRGNLRYRANSTPAEVVEHPAEVAASWVRIPAFYINVHKVKKPSDREWTLLDRMNKKS